MQRIRSTTPPVGLIRRFVIAIGLMAVFCGVVRAAETEDEPPRRYLEPAVGMMLPGAGNSLSRGMELVLRGGYEFGDDWLFEAEGRLAPRLSSTRDGGQTVGGFGVQALWRLLGYERFDPFVSFGAGTFFAGDRVFGGGDRSWACGPRAGLGAFYHLTDRISLRGDIRTSLLVDDPVGLIFDWDFGVAFSF